MKTAGLLIAALLAASVTMSAAQGTSGTAPQDKGGTAWSGSTKDQPSQDASGKKIEVHDEDKAKDQPKTASGSDLKGPTQQLAPSKTPE